MNRVFIPVKFTMRQECTRYTSDAHVIVTKQQIVYMRPFMHNVHKSSQAQHVPVLEKG